MCILDRKKYDYIQEYLTLGLTDLVSKAGIINRQNKEEVNSLESELRKKLKMATSENIKKSLEVAIKYLHEKEGPKE